MGPCGHSTVPAPCTLITTVASGGTSSRAWRLGDCGYSIGTSNITTPLLAEEMSNSLVRKAIGGEVTTQKPGTSDEGSTRFS